MTYAVYRFAYFLARPRGSKFISKEQAIQAWKVVLHGRFRRLHDFCRFVATRAIRIITEDTWCQVCLLQHHAPRLSSLIWQRSPPLSLSLSRVRDGAGCSTAGSQFLFLVLQ